MSTEIAGAAGAAPAKSLEDLSLEEALDEIEAVQAYLDRIQPEWNKAIAARNDLETLVKLRMEERGAKRFEQGEWRGLFSMKKSGSASVFEPATLRMEIERTGLVPADQIDDALPVVIPEPIVKADLRRTRKLAEFGSKVAALLKAHSVEPVEREVFVLERIPKNVTPAAGELFP